MPKFKNMNQLFNHVQSISSMVMYEVSNEIKEIILQTIKTEVYDVYEPKVYERRFANDGLLDQSNFEVNMTHGNGFVQVDIRNSTKPKDDYDKYEYLDEMIVNGINQPFERDFYEESRKVLREKLPYIVKESFAKHGIKADFKISIK